MVFQKEKYEIIQINFNSMTDESGFNNMTVTTATTPITGNETLTSVTAAFSNENFTMTTPLSDTNTTNSETTTENILGNTTETSTVTASTETMLMNNVTGETALLTFFLLLLNPST